MGNVLLTFCHIKYRRLLNLFNIDYIIIEYRLNHIPQESHENISYPLKSKNISWKIRTRKENFEAEKIRTLRSRQNYTGSY